MWAYVGFDDNVPLDVVKRWLMKTGSIDITFDIACGSAVRSSKLYPDLPTYLACVFDVIKDFLPRCRHLRLSSREKDATLALLKIFVAAPCDRLRHIILDVVPLPMFVQRLPATSSRHQSLPYLFRGRIPFLSSITFRFGLPLWPWSTSFANLTVLRLFYMVGPFAPSIVEFHDFFRCTPNLVTLYLRRVQCSVPKPFDIHTIENPPSLPNLVRADIYIGRDDPVWLLGSLRMPALRTLAMQLEQDCDLASFVGCSADFLSSITTLVVSAHFPSFDSLAVLLRSLPRLVRLDGRGSLSPFVAAFHGMTLHYETMCPHLSSVVCSTSTPAIIFDILVARTPTNFGPDLGLIVPYALVTPYPCCVLAEYRPSVVTFYKSALYDTIDYFLTPL